MTDFGRRPGEMLTSVYDTNEDGVVDACEVAPAHKTSHQDGEADEFSVEGLSGELADAQPSSWTKVAMKPSTFPPSNHYSTHQDGGDDEINATGLVGRVNYVNRGEATSTDLVKTDLVLDGHWYSLDLTSILPAAAVAVCLHLEVKDDVVGGTFRVAPFDDPGDFNSMVIRPQVANIRIHTTGIVAVTYPQWCSYWGTDLAWAVVNVTVMGWFI